MAFSRIAHAWSGLEVPAFSRALRGRTRTPTTTLSVIELSLEREKGELK